MNKEEIIEKLFKEEFISTNKDKLEEIILFLKSLKEEFTLEESDISLEDILNKLNKNINIDLSLKIDNNSLITKYNFNTLNDLIINNLPRTISKLNVSESFILNNLNKLKEFTSLEELTINSYRFIDNKTLEYLINNTSIKKINFNGYIFNEEDYNNSIFIRTNNSTTILSKDIVITNNTSNSSIKEDEININIIDNFSLENINKIYPYIENINKINIKSLTGEYIINKEDKNISIDVYDKDINITYYLYKYFTNKGYTIKDVSFSLENKKGETILEDYTSIDYTLIDKLNKLTNLTVKYNAYIKKSTYEDFKGLVMSMKYYKKLINDYNLSPVEKLTFAYDIMKSFTYNETTNKDTFESRDPYKIIKTGNIVCVGYTNMLAEILKGTEGISFTDASVSCYESDNETLLGHHSRGIVKIDDDKYNIHGVYIVDPTWDSYKKNGNERLGDDYTALDLYTYFLVSPQDYKRVFPNDSIPNFFKSDYKYLNTNMDKIESYEELKSKEFTDKDLFTFNFEELFKGNITNEEKLKYLKSKRIDKNLLMEIIRNTRLAEGFSKDDVNKEMERISDYYSKLSNLEIDELTGKIK